MRKEYDFVRRYFSGEPILPHHEEKVVEYEERGLIKTQFEIRNWEKVKIAKLTESGKDFYRELRKKQPLLVRIFKF